MHYGDERYESPKHDSQIRQSKTFEIVPELVPNNKKPVLAHLSSFDNER